MEQISFVFTVFFMLLGPLKLIPAFAGTTRGMDAPFKRSVAIRGALIASALCLFLALTGQVLLAKYHISIDALRLSGGLVLLIAALNVIFRQASPSTPVSGTPMAWQFAASPVAVPGIVPPGGVVAILLIVMLSPEYPGMMQAVAISLAVVMVLDFLVMYFIDAVLRTPGLSIVLPVLGSALVFMQAGLAVEIILSGLRHLGVLPA